MTLIERVLNRGDRAAITNGFLAIVRSSGQPVEKAKLKEHGGSIVADIASKLGIEPICFIGFSTGSFGAKGYPGVLLQFETLQAEPRYAIFNVGLTRTRGSRKAKAGTPYPGKQFAVRRSSHFYRFWTHSGLKHPKSLTAYHDYMGHLKGRYFTADISGGERLDAGSIKPMAISYEELLTLFCPNKSRIMPGQAPDNIRTIHPDKHLALNQAGQGFQAISATGEICYGISKQGSEVQGSSNPQSETKRIQEQSDDEWLSDYGAAAPWTKP